MFVAEGGVSVFEFLTSGAPDLLFHFLTSNECNQSLEERWEIFALQMEAGEHERTPLQCLLTLLQNSLIQSEKFAILLNDKKGFGSGIKYLAKPFKLRLHKSDDEKMLVDFSSNIVGIEPLASVAAVEKFLWDKIQPTEEEQKAEEERQKQQQEQQNDQMIDDDEIVIEDTTTNSSDFEEFAEDSEYVLDVQPPQGLRASACSPIQQKQSLESQKKLQFYYNDNPLSSDDNIFRILQNNFNKNIDISTCDTFSHVTPAERLWNMEHNITYKRVSSSSNLSNSSNSSPLSLSSSSFIDFNNLDKNLQDPNCLSFIHSKSSSNRMDYFMKNELCFFDRKVPDDLKTVLLFIKFLHAFMTIWQSSSEKVKLNRNQKDLSNDLISNKITLKLSQQLQDTLLLCCGELPPWCSFITNYCSFLIPFDIRRQYFICTQLGIARALHCLQQIHPPEGDAKQFKIGRIHRQKVRVSRFHILKCVFRVMELYGRSKAVLEVEFFDEAGTGLGPTLEFFTLVSHQLQRRDLDMWCYDNTYSIPTEDNTIQDPNKSSSSLRLSSNDNPLQVDGPFEYISNRGGLFPRPLKESDEKFSFIRKMFQLFGVVAGKALLDERMLDIHLSIPFYKWFIGEPLGLNDLELIYPEIGKTLREFVEIDKKYQNELKSSGKSKEEISKYLKYNDSTFDDLCLSFVLPNNPNWELKENGKNQLLSLDNLSEYIHLVIDQLLITGVRIQMEAFRKGFQSVFPISSLSCFSVFEIDSLLCGTTTDTQDNYWDTNAILDSIVCDHQYTINSLPVQYFAAALHSLSKEEKRNFMFFLTGTPRLPIGGFKSLHPRLTVVRKDTEGPSDDYLPSVMTCVNYVKLPAYSTLEVATKQIKRAISEGLASFHLS